MRSYVKTFSGFCPEQNENASVDVEIGIVPMLGARTPGEKPLRFSCPYYSIKGFCKTAGNDGNECPLFIKAQSESI